VSLAFFKSFFNTLICCLWGELGGILRAFAIDFGSLMSNNAMRCKVQYSFKSEKHTLINYNLNVNHYFKSVGIDISYVLLIKDNKESERRYILALVKDENDSKYYSFDGYSIHLEWTTLKKIEFNPITRKKIERGQEI
jgi:hypothetical protein